MHEYLSAADAARILSVTPAAVRAMERRGVLPAVAHTPGGIRLFHRRDVEKLARQREGAVGRRPARGPRRKP